MIRGILCLLLLATVLVGGFGATQQPAEKPSSADELFLQQAKIATEDGALLHLLAGRILQDPDRIAIQNLIGNLDSNEFQLRQRAQTILVQRGPLAVPFLKKALPRASLDLRKRLEQTIQEIEKTSHTEQAVAAARLLTARAATKSPALREKTLTTLLNLVPFIDDHYAEDEILACVARLGLRGGKVDPLLQAALKDPMPERRAVAGFVVAQYGSPLLRDQVRAYLADKDQTVQLRVAAGLLGKNTVLGSREQVKQALAAFDQAKLLPWIGIR